MSWWPWSGPILAFSLLAWWPRSDPIPAFSLMSWWPRSGPILAFSLLAWWPRSDPTPHSYNQNKAKQIVTYGFPISDIMVYQITCFRPHLFFLFSESFLGVHVV